MVLGKTTSVFDKILEPIVTNLGYEYVGASYRSQGKHSLLRLYIDSPNGINVDDCSLVSRQVSAVLDVEDPIQSEYSLEVSSPGLDRPLFTLAHYEKFVGSEIKIRLRNLSHGQQRNLKGMLKKTEGETIILLVDNEELPIKLADIERGNLVAVFTIKSDGKSS